MLSDDLTAARALIDTEEKWGKGAFSSNRGGHQCYCAAGAIRVATWGGVLISEARPKQFLRYTNARSFIETKVLNDASLTDYNDRHTHADIMALFDRAISAAISEEK